MDFDDQFEYFPSSVVLYKPDNLFKVFPNPTTDLLHITTSSDLKKASIFIKTLSSQEKKVEISTSAHQATLDLSELPAGVYLVGIVFPESVFTKRIVKR